MHAAGHFPPSSAELENAWSFISTPLICLHGMHRDSFNLLYFTEEQTWSSGEVGTVMEKPAASIFRREEDVTEP